MFWARSNTDRTEDGFTDLYRADFISAVGRVSRRKMERLHASPYHHALLRRGISKREEEEDVSQDLRQAMEYARAVGVGLLEVVEETSHRVEVQVSALDLVVTDMDERVQDTERRIINLGGVEGVAQEAWQMAVSARDATENIQTTRDRVVNLEERMEDTELVHMEVDERLTLVERDVNEAKFDVTMLVATRDRMGRDLQRIRDVVVDQQDMITDLHNLVDLLREQVLALQHGAGNPIVIEDFGGTDSEDSESSEDDDDDVVMFYPAPEGLLVPIEDDEGSTAVSSAW